jgi:lysophospholipase L1-like esterase
MRWGLRLAGGLLGLLVALELALQLAALFVKDSARGAEAAFRNEHHRVLCLGDSNTYGLWVEPSQAWPAVFEREWNARHPDRPIEVLNLGFPGMNSSRILDELPRLLRVLRPDTVMVMVGANDYWTVPAARSEAALWPRVEAALWNLRTYRLLYMLRRSLAAPAKLEIPPVPMDDATQGQGTFRLGDERFDFGWRSREGSAEAFEAGLSETLVRNLTAMASLVRGAGARFVLVTYPSEQHLYGHSNRRIREVARATATPLVDLGFVFRYACPNGLCDLFLEDQHPTAPGHERAGRHMAAEVRALGVL